MNDTASMVSHEVQNTTQSNTAEIWQGQLDQEALYDSRLEQHFCARNQSCRGLDQQDLITQQQDQACSTLEQACSRNGELHISVTPGPAMYYAQSRVASQPNTNGAANLTGLLSQTPLGLVPALRSRCAALHSPCWQSQRAQPSRHPRSTSQCGQTYRLLPV